jgi:hypothetical protein
MKKMNIQILSKIKTIKNIENDNIIIFDTRKNANLFKLIQNNSQSILNKKLNQGQIDEVVREVFK